MILMIIYKIRSEGKPENECLENHFLSESKKKEIYWILQLEMMSISHQSIKPAGDISLGLFHGRKRFNHAHLIS